jgi:hypothetical protein
VRRRWRSPWQVPPRLSPSRPPPRRRRRLLRLLALGESRHPRGRGRPGGGASPRSPAGVPRRPADRLPPRRRSAQSRRLQQRRPRSAYAAEHSPATIPWLGREVVGSKRAPACCPRYGGGTTRAAPPRRLGLAGRRPAHPAPAPARRRASGGRAPDRSANRTSARSLLWPPPHGRAACAVPLARRHLRRCVNGDWQRLSEKRSASSPSAAVPPAPPRGARREKSARAVQKTATVARRTAGCDTPQRRNKSFISLTSLISPMLAAAVPMSVGPPPLRAARSARRVAQCARRGDQPTGCAGTTAGSTGCWIRYWKISRATGAAVAAP